VELCRHGGCDQQYSGLFFKQQWPIKKNYLIKKRLRSLADWACLPSPIVWFFFVPVIFKEMSRPVIFVSKILWGETWGGVVLEERWGGQSEGQKRFLIHFGVWTRSRTFWISWVIYLNRLFFFYIFFILATLSFPLVILSLASKRSINI
jgi:hypothetical protein